MSDINAPASGRFVLRIDPALHGRLRAEAAGQGLSLNELCGQRLAQPGVGAAGPVVARAAALLGPAVLAVLAFGSWARGFAGSESDVDILVVAARSVRLTRALYARWDELPLRLEGRRVEPHFVHLPEGAKRPSGLWCEVAVDGLVLYDRDLETARYLAWVRSLIASGEVRRALAHGQPYWVGAA